MSIFYDLSYWKSHYIRHYLDVTRIEKNVCESIVGTLLDDPHKTKDEIKARRDLKEMKIRGVFHPGEGGKKPTIQLAKYTLVRAQRLKLCK